MHSKTVSKILISLIMIAMFIAIMPALPVQAVTLDPLSPAVGPVGTEVTITGTIDTYGGQYQIAFDVAGDGLDWPGDVLVTANAPADSINVVDTITVPACLGSDVGENHAVGLRDSQTLNVQSRNFGVQTSRSLTADPTYGQEGDNFALTMSVTGGTEANQLNTYDITITYPDGSSDTFSEAISFMSDATGSGSGTTTWVGFTTLTGTYDVVADRVQPGIYTNAGSTSFDIGLVDATSFARFDMVDIQTAGWTQYQNVSVTITDPSAAVIFTEEVNITATGIYSTSWMIPWNAELGTYTVSALNATGDNKAVDSVSTFDVVAAADVAAMWVTDPMISYVRTDVVEATFNITYPDDSLFTADMFSSIDVNVYANDTMVDTVSLTTDAYNATTGNWTVMWPIPWDAASGMGYKFHLDTGDIVDTAGNMGPLADTPSGEFTVLPCNLDVMVIEDPAPSYGKTEIVTATINITYPDGMPFTDAHLGEVLVRVYLEDEGDINVANVTLMAEDYNATTNEWTISWSSAYDDELGFYYFAILEDEVYDSANPNMGPTDDVMTTSFELLPIDIIVESINTDKAEYGPGEYVHIYFDAMYADGNPVTVISDDIMITLGAPDNYTELDYWLSYVPTGRWAITIWLSDAQAQTGNWSIILPAFSLDDGGGNTGPAEDVTTSFIVLPAPVTLQDIMDAIAALDARIDDVETALDDVQGDTTGLAGTISSLTATINSLQSQVSSLSSQLGDVASASDLAVLEDALDTMDAHMAALFADVASISDIEGVVDAHLTALYDDVADLSAAFDDLSAAVDALDSALDSLSDSAVSSDDLDTATDELSDSIGGLNTMVIIAVVLALIAAIAAIAAVFIIQRLAW
jgi:archaellum component FlaC